MKQSIEPGWMTTLPSWCFEIDEIVKRVAKRRGMTPEEVMKSVTSNNGMKES